MIDPIVVTPGSHVVGDTVRIRIGIGVGDIQSGTMITISEVRHKLDCVVSEICEFCVDEGNVISYQGNVATDCKQPSGLFDTIWDVPPAVDPNEVAFVATPQPQELLAGESCWIDFDVKIEAAGGAPTPMFVEAASCFDGICDNLFPAASRGTIAIAISQPQVELDKQVSCDSGATWDDVGFGDGVIAGCTAATGQPILVRYVVNNLASAEVMDCTLTDSNGAVLAAAVDIGDLNANFNGVIHQAGPFACEESLTVGEPDTATLVCQDGLGGTVGDSDSATFGCSDCQFDVDKQISCDGGWNWVDVGFNDGVIDGCEAEHDGQSIKARYLLRNTSGLTLENCFLSDSNYVLQNDPPLGDLAPGFEGIVWETIPRQCNDELDELEPDTATVVCECAGAEVAATDQAWFDCRDCDVDVDRQVSCDGGATWHDTGWRDGVSQGCTAGDGAAVKVRYMARTRSIKTLENCTLTDSNTALLAAPVDVGTLDIAFEGVVLEVDATCSAALDSGGPDTVALSCECEATCQDHCAMCPNYCLPGCPPDTSADNTDESTLICN